MTPLVWSQTPPTEPGWYWARERYHRESGIQPKAIFLVSIVGNTPFLRLESAHTPAGWKAEVNIFNFGEWAGPIPQPAEPTEVAEVPE